MNRTSIRCATVTFALYWNSINWKKVEREVFSLQRRIVKAVKEKRFNKVKVLQRILTHSFHAKLLAVKRVTQNKGKRTAGIDKVLWNTASQKMEAAKSLILKGYKAKPLRRKLIPKKNGKYRALGIPTMKDRAMQSLFKMALEPVAETLADPNSYGFRQDRCCADAIEQCFIALKWGYSAKWVLEADIKACFDWIEHDWLLKNIPIDLHVLTQWLKCGFMQNKKLFPTKAGTPQGGVMTPLTQ